MSKLWVFVIISIGFIFGFCTGMLVQQAVIQATLMKVASNMDGVEINVNVNETKMVNAITDFYRPSKKTPSFRVEMNYSLNYY